MNLVYFFKIIFNKLIKYRILNIFLFFYIFKANKFRKKYTEFKFKCNDTLLFGRESAGVPESLHKSIKEKLKIPMNKKTRSLNIGMSVAIIASEALRQNNLL